AAIGIGQVGIARRRGELGRLDLAAVWSGPVRGVLHTIADRQRTLGQRRPLRLRRGLAGLGHDRWGQRGGGPLRVLTGLASWRQALTGQALTGQPLPRQILAR